MEQKENTIDKAVKGKKNVYQKAIEAIDKAVKGIDDVLEYQRENKIASTRVANVRRSLLEQKKTISLYAPADDK